MASETLKTQAVPPIEEPEIVAVNPPPGDPKRSQPPPPVVSASAQQYQYPPLSPVVQQLQRTSISTASSPPPPHSQYYQHYNHHQHHQADTNVPELLVELPDTSIDRPRSPLDAAEGDAKKVVPPRKAPVNDVTVLVAEDVVLTPGGQSIDLSEFEDLVGERNLGVRVQEQYKQAKLKKLRDPAVLIEIPGSPSAQAYEVAHSNKLQDQYFNPVYEDGSETPQSERKDPAAAVMAAAVTSAPAVKEENVAPAVEAK